MILQSNLKGEARTCVVEKEDPAAAIKLTFEMLDAVYGKNTNKRNIEEKLADLKFNQTDPRVMRLDLAAHQVVFHSLRDQGVSECDERPIEILAAKLPAEMRRNLSLFMTRQGDNVSQAAVIAEIGVLIDSLARDNILLRQANVVAPNEIPQSHLSPPHFVAVITDDKDRAYSLTFMCLKMPNGHHLLALVDTGASMSMICHKTARMLNIPIKGTTRLTISGFHESGSEYSNIYGLTLETIDRNNPLSVLIVGTQKMPKLPFAAPTFSTQDQQFISDNDIDIETILQGFDPLASGSSIELDCEMLVNYASVLLDDLVYAEIVDPVTQKKKKPLVPKAKAPAQTATIMVASSELGSCQSIVPYDVTNSISKLIQIVWFILKTYTKTLKHKQWTSYVMKMFSTARSRLQEERIVRSFIIQQHYEDSKFRKLPSLSGLRMKMHCDVESLNHQNAEEEEATSTDGQPVYTPALPSAAVFDTPDTKYAPELFPVDVLENIKEPTIPTLNLEKFNENIKHHPTIGSEGAPEDQLDLDLLDAKDAQYEDPNTVIPDVVRDHAAERLPVGRTREYLSRKAKSSATSYVTLAEIQCQYSFTRFWCM
ncbi:unnamed protein product [Caenorhabditis brenneri]